MDDELEVNADEYRNWPGTLVGENQHLVVGYRRTGLGCFLVFVVLLFASPVRAQRQAPLSQQKQCAQQAKKAFTDYLKSPSYGSKDVLPPTHTSHFDAKAGSCYVLILTGTSADGGTSLLLADQVLDAFEGRVAASYAQQRANGKRELLWCSVHPRGQEEIVCKTEEEFNQLIAKHFGIAR